MQDRAPLTTSAYPLTIMQHEETGHFLATCEHLPPFIAHGPSLADLRENSRIVLKRILEKQGCTVSSVEISPQPPHLPDSIRVTEITAVATYECAA